MEVDSWTTASYARYVPRILIDHTMSLSRDQQTAASTVMDRMTHPNIFGSLLIETFVEHYYVCELGCAILCCIQNMSRVG